MEGADAGVRGAGDLGKEEANGLAVGEGGGVLAGGGGDIATAGVGVEGAVVGLAAGEAAEGLGEEVVGVGRERGVGGAVCCRAAGRVDLRMRPHLASSGFFLGFEN